ncbi:MAG TPA: aquaporin Z [Rhizomicrobium sp.]|nr:aquaporin Z [Rhizomicrobium sp.]
MDSSRKIVAEFIGTFWLVLGGCGSAVLAAGVPDVGIGYAGVALAFGLTVLTGAYAFGHVSGAHFNPAVSFGLFVAGRLSTMDLFVYWVAQLLGGIAAGGVLYVIASGMSGFDPSAGFAANGFGAHSPQHYSMLAGLVCEIVMTFMFLIVILNVTLAAPAYAPIAIGLCLTLIHLISIPVTNTSVNPARSTGVAIFQGSWALEQLWLFWLAPLIGAGLAGVLQRWFVGRAERAASPKLAS